MSQEYRNIYQISRETAGITQERAAELMDISVESIRAYEQDKRRPPDEIVIKMVEIYNAHYLPIQHLKKSKLGQIYIPEFELKNLTSAMLKLQKELNDVLRCQEEMIDITYDGKITEDERQRWEEIKKELGDVWGAILTVIYAEDVKEERR